MSGVPDDGWGLSCSGVDLPGLVLGKNMAETGAGAGGQGQKKEDRSKHTEKGKCSKLTKFPLLHFSRPQPKLSQEPIGTLSQGLLTLCQAPYDPRMEVLLFLLALSPSGHSGALRDVKSLMTEQGLCPLDKA